ncbi:MAG: DEAD/DEAH box helicase [Planctomycetes bacterium]|nr:DEAD/DEAH box helicase [Planctomycetota bacterium]
MTGQTLFAPGSLVRARRREWIVQPGSSAELLRLRPLGGSDEEEIGICTRIEPVESASFPLPDLRHIGDFTACRLLRDAIRLGFRGAAGPFRSFARIAVQPRPYQLVPLLMALRLDPVRLLIADDVGIGKTIEAALIVRELLDRGEIRRFSVLCPPHLAEQWQSELSSKFHLDATLVLAGTARRLERELLLGEQLFERYPFTIVSLDFIKSEQHRHAFLNACPELIVIDEAHACADPGVVQHVGHQRYRLVRQLCDDPRRHVILVTATPHSGNEAAFRSLLGFLDREFADLPEDLSGKEHEAQRRRLARHIVLRRRKDIADYLGEGTSFPERWEREDSYTLHPAYRRLCERILAHIHDSVGEAGLQERARRVRWWSALALLQAIASSPAAAVATLRKRAEVADAEDVAQADMLGRSLLDLGADPDDAVIDIAPGSDPDEAPATEPEPASDDGQQTARRRRQLQSLAKQAEALKGEAHDAKLAKAIGIVCELLREGHRPIVFCRFIDTAEYVAEHLRAALCRQPQFQAAAVAAVTGALPPEEREERVAKLAEHTQRVLVATDCLSEGINLQAWFDAVLHYDLSWNPTRHEQREGRIDRFGQRSPRVAIVTYYGIDNGVDGIVLDVLLRKHRSIRRQLGISVPVPLDTGQVLEAVMESLIMRGRELPADLQQDIIPGLEQHLAPQRQRLQAAWTRASDHERRSRSLFAQHAIRVEEVQAELAAVRATLGSPLDLRRFLEGVLRRLGGVVAAHPRDQEHAITVDLRGAEPIVRDQLGLAEGQTVFAGAFDPQSPALGDPACRMLVRTHPAVAQLAALVLDRAIDPALAPLVGRCGAIKTRRVARRTTVLLLRLRFECTMHKAELPPATQIAEECRPLAFEGPTEQPSWLPDDEVEALLDAPPDANIPPELARTQLQRLLESWPELTRHLEPFVHRRAAALLEANRRVRDAIDARGRFEVRPYLPPDLLAVFILLPVN